MDKINIPFATVKYMHDEIREELDNAFKTVMDDNYFIGGKYCEAFENEFAEYCGVKYAVGCANGLDAINLTLRA